MPDETEELVKVHFDLPETEMGVSGESLWAAEVGLNLYELRNSPWHARQVNWLDIVEAVPAKNGEWPEYVRVYKRGGHRTIHLYVLDLGLKELKHILEQCSLLGCTYEGADSKMYALDFPPGVEVEPAIEYFESLEAGELASWRINDYK
jgi:hypothetical protein